MEEYLNNMNKLMEQSIKFTQNINQEMEKGITQMYYIGAMETIISIIITIVMIYYIYKANTKANEAERKIRILEMRIYELEDHIEKTTKESIKHKIFFD